MGGELHEEAGNVILTLVCNKELGHHCHLPPQETSMMSKEREMREALRQERDKVSEPSRHILKHTSLLSSEISLCRPLAQ